MEGFWDSVSVVFTAYCTKILFALAVYLIGSWAISFALKMMKKSKLTEKMDETVRSFMLSMAKAVLYIVLVIGVIGILGVPMASVITVLASCGVAVGLALQGALSNIAGGIMLMLFKPFKVGDFVEAAGVSGVAQEITLLYSVFITPDNKRVTVPNGTLMNANVVDYSSEPTRRVDLNFTVAKSEVPANIKAILLEAASQTANTLTDPEPFAGIVGGSDTAMEFVVRVWCKSENYWDVYFALNQAVVEAFAKANVQQPSSRVTVENK